MLSWDYVLGQHDGVYKITVEMGISAGMETETTGGEEV